MKPSATRSTEKVALPVNRVYFTQVGNLRPGEQALMQNAEWYLANQRLTFLPGVHLFTKDLAVTKAMKQKLGVVAGESAVVLVGDLTESADNGCHVERDHLNAVITHMSREQEILAANSITIGAEGYPSLLDDPRLFVPDGVKGSHRSYAQHPNIEIKLLFDGTLPEAFADPAHPRRSMAHAIETGEELCFLQR